MRRCVTIISIALFVCTTSFAQIQKSVLGVSLGSTTRTKVQEMFPNGRGNWAGDIDIACYPGSELDGAIVRGEPALNIHNPKFAGIEWDYANFSFYNGVLCEVDFSSEDRRDGTTETLWKELCRALSNKYGSYRKTRHTANGPKDISYEIYSDGTTRIVTCCYDTFYVLKYQNISLFKKKYQNKLDSSEL